MSPTTKGESKTSNARDMSGARDTSGEKKRGRPAATNGVMKPISMRMDPQVVGRLKRVASKKGVGYQTLVRMWVHERLEQELEA